MTPIVGKKIAGYDVVHLWPVRRRNQLWHSFCGRTKFYGSLGDDGGQLCKRCAESPRGKRLSVLQPRNE